MRALLIVLVGSATFAQVADAETWRVRDAVKFASEASDLLGGRRKAATTTTSRVISTIDAEPGSWSVTYEAKTLNSVAIPDAAGRSYKVRLEAGTLVVEPLSPTDDAGLPGVSQDLRSVYPIFAGEPLCPSGLVGMCPSVLSLLESIGDVVVKDASDPTLVRIEVTSPNGERLAGTARLGAEEWIVELVGTRTDQLSFDAQGGPGVKEAESKCRYDVVREIVKD